MSDTRKSSMTIWMMWALSFWCVSGAALAADPPDSVSAARSYWERTRTTPQYQQYVQEFVQFNNSLRIDERSGCYAQGVGRVEIFLVVTVSPRDAMSAIDRVFVDPLNNKGACFQRAYTRLPVKQPPFLPFVIQMAFE